jgi:hypothetical protein
MNTHSIILLLLPAESRAVATGGQSMSKLFVNAVEDSPRARAVAARLIWDIAEFVCCFYPPDCGLLQRGGSDYVKFSFSAVVHSPRVRAVAAQLI